MGFCRSRYFMLAICFLQFITVIQRQVFDFLGYLYIPILLNFFQIIFIIFGSFGGFQYRPKYIITYVLWNFMWLGWNIFLICLYLDIGVLDHKENMVLKLDRESGSWWINGPGCKQTLIGDDNVHVDGCLLEYEYIEIFQGALQSVLAFLGIVSGLCLSKIFLEEDDSSSPKFVSTGSSRKKKSASSKQQRLSLYSIEFSPHGADANDDAMDDDLDTDDDENIDTNASQAPVSPKPMTPRRVKRRSVMQRGSSGRHSSSSNRRVNTTNRSSTRSSGRRITAQNPVTRLLEQQQQQQQQMHQHVSYDSPSTGAESPLQHYYNNIPSGVVLAPHHSSVNTHWSGVGHTNPTYQQSSTQSLNEPFFDVDSHNNRPASARSSYSNFHGTRPISYGGGAVTQTTHAQVQPPYNHSHATAQVPLQRRANTNLRSNKAFLNNGPPAYSSSQQQHSAPPIPFPHPVDSETTI